MKKTYAAVSFRDYRSAALTDCKIVLTTKKGVGCRVVGDTLCKLALRYRSIERLPERIFIQATPSVQTRALLTLAALTRPRTRGEILSTFELEHIAAGANESAEAYEKRAVALALMRFPGYRKLEPARLLVKGVRSIPDGLFLGEVDGTLVIVEVKKRAPDFEEGASQIVQYYAQAKSHPEFRHLTIQTRLITAERYPTQCYNVWQDLMSSTRELSFLVYQA